MIINFKVIGDTIETSNKETFYTGNVNSYICEFDFSEEWNGVAAFCVMTNGKKCVTLYITENRCTIPAEILSGKGNVKLGLYGTDGNKRISTNNVMLRVKEGAYEIGEDDMTIPIPDVWEQLILKTVPKIGDNGNWFIWDMTENQYVDSGVLATVKIDEFYKKTEIDKNLSAKVDKESGKGLSSNDYTNEEKEKLAGLSNYDDTEIKKDINDKVDKVTGKGLSTNDFTDEDKTKLEGLQDGQYYTQNFNYLTEQDESLSRGVMKVEGRVADHERTTQESINQLWDKANTKEDSANKVTTLDNNSTDTQYPSAKATYGELVKKADIDDLGLQFVNLDYFSETADFDKLDIVKNCYGCFRIRSDRWLTAILNASVSGDFKQGYSGSILENMAAPTITVYFIVRQGNTITKGPGSSETTSTQIFYSGDVYIRTIHETSSNETIEDGGTIFEW